MIRKLAFILAIIGVFAISSPANALGVIWYRVSSDNASYNFGDQSSTRYSKIAQSITMQDTRQVCDVDAKIYRIGAATSAIVKLTVYQHGLISYSPDSALNYTLAQIGVGEASVPQDPGSGYTQYTTFSLYTDGDTSQCPILQKGSTYSFVFTRDPLTNGTYNLMIRYRSTDEFAYSDAFHFCSGAGCGYGWQDKYPSELAIQLSGLYYDAGMAADAGILGDLFMPSTSTLARLEIVSEDLQDRVPLGYYYALKEQAELLSTSTPSDFVWYFHMDGSETLLPYPTSTLNLTDTFDAIPQSVRDWAYGGALAYMMIEFWAYIIGVVRTLFKPI